MTCGQVWECATCRALELGKRASALVAVLQAHRAHGGAGYLLTLTMRRPEAVPLSDALARIRASWEDFRGSSTWRAFAAELAGHARGLEVTAGLTGWHVHLHLLVMPRHAWSADELGAIRTRLAYRWADAVELSAGLRWRPRTDRVGCDLRPCDAARYIAKLGLEVSNAAPTKEGRKSDRFGVWQVLRMTRGTGRQTREWARLRWAEYCEAMKGAKALQASNELAAAMQLYEPSEEELETLGEIPAPLWRVVSRRPEWCEAIARLLGEGKPREVQTELESLGMARHLAIEAQAAIMRSNLDRWKNDLDRTVELFRYLIPAA
jgi:hypothetical protein